jgi:7tm Odorant receptor
MFEQSTPFRQFSFIFKLFGFQPKLISKRHKQIASVMFIMFGLIHGLFIILPIYQNTENPTAKIEFIFQAPFILIDMFKMIYYFVNFDKMEKFKKKLSELCNDCDGNFIEAFKSAKILFIAFYTPFMMLGLLSAIVPLFTKTPFLVFWKLPIEINEDLYFYITWIQQTIGIFYNIIIANAMKMYPFCIMIMLREYLNKLNEKFRSAINKEEFLKCVNKQRKIKGLVREFQDIFSPLFIIKAFLMMIAFGATLLIMVLQASLRTFLVNNYHFVLTFFPATS